MKYRAEIDGLRALAVVPVILFHAGFELFSGGFVGVDVFFVISGYLITTILIEDMENKRFSIINFYERRIRRILPALFFVMFMCVPFAWIWMIPSQIQDFSQSLVAVSIFVSNIFFWRETDYFETAAEEKPLLHTWSLAVEEQYYVLFPIFLIFSWRFGKSRVFWMIIVMAAISLLLSEWGWRNRANANFYLAPTRAWELLAGSIAALLIYKQGARKNNFLASLGLVAIIFSIFFYDENTPIPSIYGLVPVLGTVLLVLYADKKTIVAKLLSLKPIVAIGLISYSAYLWHQPFFAFSRIRFPNQSSDLFMIILCLLSLFTSYLCWKYIEKPFRNRNIFKQKVIFKLSIFGVIFYICIGIFSHIFSYELEKYWVSLKSDDYKKIYSLINKGPIANNYGALKDGSIDGKQNISECIFNARRLEKTEQLNILKCYKKYGRGVLILGDSHAIDLFGVVASQRKNNFIVGITRGACRPSSNKRPCHFEDVLEFLEKYQNKFKLVIYEQAGLDFLQQKDGKPVSRKTFLKLKETEAVENIIIKKEGVKKTVDFLNVIAKNVNVKWFLPRASPHLKLRDILTLGCRYSFTYRENQYETFIEIDNYIKSYLSQNFLNSINPISQNDIFQFKFPKDYLSCDEVYWSDGDHFSAEGEKYFGNKLPNNFLVP